MRLDRTAWTGTSQATPMALGALALTLGKTLTVDRKKLADKLENSADVLYDNHRNQMYKDGLGKGRLNIEVFLQAVIK